MTFVADGALSLCGSLRSRVSTRMLRDSRERPVGSIVPSLGSACFDPMPSTPSNLALVAGEAIVLGRGVLEEDGALQ